MRKKVKKEKLTCKNCHQFDGDIEGRCLKQGVIVGQWWKACHHHQDHEKTEAQILQDSIFNEQLAQNNIEREFNEKVKKIMEIKEEVNKMEEIERLQMFFSSKVDDINEFLLTNPKIYKIKHTQKGVIYKYIYYWKPFYRCGVCNAISEENHCKACELKRTICEHCGVKRLKRAPYCYECGGKLE